MPRGTLFHRPTPTILPISQSSSPANKTMDATKRRSTRFARKSPTSRLILGIICAVFSTFILTRFFAQPLSHGQQRKWHGGHPAQERTGSCWCGDEDGYCMCTPALSVDIVLYEKRGEGYNVWVVRRKDTGQLGTIGG